MTGVQTCALPISGSLDFGEVAVGQPREMTFTVTNNGSGTLTGSAAVEGEDTGFYVLAPSTFSLLGGQSATIQVRFSPGQVGDYEATILFTSNGGNTSCPVEGVAVEGKRKLRLIE